MRKETWIAVVVLLGVALIAISSVLYFRPRPADSSAPAKDTGEKVVVRLLRKPLDVSAFTVTDLDGKTMSSTDWQGKVVLINFWATWCGPCRIEIPDLIALQNKYRDHLVIVGVSEDEASVEIVKDFATKYQINYPVVMSTPELRARFPGVAALPTTYVLDRDGRVVQKQVGLLSARQTEAATRLLAGLDVNAEVERVDDPNRLSQESITQLKEIPGVDLQRVSADRRGTVLQALNTEKCSCGCDLSVAKCRIDDPSCAISLPLAQTIIDKHVGN